MRLALWFFGLSFLAISLQAALTDEECLGCHDTINAKAFASSVHAALTCTGCHADVIAAPHESKPKPVDCAICHDDAVAAWRGSLHAKGIQTGVRSATCLDCHGPVHEILAS